MSEQEKKIAEVSPSLEDYLETILDLQKGGEPVRLTDIAAALSLSKPSASRAVGNLKSRGLLEQQKYGTIELTHEGESIAASVMRRHETLKGFLLNILKVDEAIAEKDACAIEHVISPETFERFLEFYNEQNKEK